MIRLEPELLQAAAAVKSRRAYQFSRVMEVDVDPGVQDAVVVHVGFCPSADLEISRYRIAVSSP